MYKKAVSVMRIRYLKYRILKFSVLLIFLLNSGITCIATETLIDNADMMSDISTSSITLTTLGSGRQPNDPYFMFTQDTAVEIGLPMAWNLYTNASLVTVGVLDSGIAENHDDLYYNYVDGKSFVGTAPNTDNTSYSHGTRVAGIIGAEGNNAIGMAGVCWNVCLYSLQTVDSTGHYYDDRSPEVMDHAQQENIKLINASCGGYYTNIYEENAFCNFDGLIICSAGNEGNNNDEILRAPSCYNTDNIISVGALDGTSIWSDSNYGATTVDVFAPGSNIYSATRTGDYSYDSGTSYAAPYVTGIAALIWSAYPDFTAAEVKEAIMRGVDTLPALAGKSA